jgi:hypothetical protein
MVKTGLQIIDPFTLFLVDSDPAAFEIHGAVLAG